MNVNSLLCLLGAGILAAACSSDIPKHLSKKGNKTEAITISNIGYDPYGQDCGGGISVMVRDATLSKENIGKSAFLAPSEEQYPLPDGLVPSGGNALTFFGNFAHKRCIHLMSGHDTSLQELFFVYDSVRVGCPYQLFNGEKMEFYPQTCGRHPIFHERITVIEQ